MYVAVEFLKNDIYLNSINEKGEAETDIIFDYVPTMLIPDKDGDWKSLKDNVKLTPKKIGLEKFNEEKNRLIEKLNGRVYNAVPPNYQYISDNYYGKGGLTKKLRHHHLDIEVMIDGEFPNPIEASHKVTLIQIYETDTNEVKIFGTKVNSYKKKEENGYTVTYHLFESERQMLRAYIKYTKDRNPVTVNAWFGYGFDFPYIINRCINLDIDYKDLSPFRMFKKKKVSIFGKTSEILLPYGRYFLDSQEVYKHFKYGNQESYSLEFIAQDELGRGKVKYGHIASDLDDVYHNSYDMFVEYGIQDVVLLNELDKKLDYISIMMSQAWDMGVNFDDVFSTVKPWTYNIYNKLKESKTALPLHKEAVKKDYAGAYIMHPIKGKYEYIINYDVTSLYPNAMRANNISYETIVDYEDYTDYMKELQKNIIEKGKEVYLISLNKKERKEIINFLKSNNLILSPTGEFFKKEIDGVIPEVVKSIFIERKKSQKKSEHYGKLLETIKTIKMERSL